MNLVQNLKINEKQKLVTSILKSNPRYWGMLLFPKATNYGDKNSSAPNGQHSNKSICSDLLWSKESFCWDLLWKRGGANWIEGENKPDTKTEMLRLSSYLWTEGRERKYIFCTWMFFLHLNFQYVFVLVMKLSLKNVNTSILPVSPKPPRYSQFSACCSPQPEEKRIFS